MKRCPCSRTKVSLRSQIGLDDEACDVVCCSMAVSPFLSRVSARWVSPPTRRHRLPPLSTLFEYTSGCQRRKIRELSEIRSHHVAGYVERLDKTHPTPTAK